jgi:hypothetical protein
VFSLIGRTVENVEIGKENGSARVVNNISETARRLREAVMIAAPEIGTLTD